MLVHTYEEINQLIVDNLNKIKSLKFDYIVHLPRSGTAPAAMIATYLRVPLASVDEWCNGLLWTRGSTMRPNANPTILLVDDSLRTGKQMKENVEKIKKARHGTIIKTMSIFRSPCPSDRTRVFNVDLALCDDNRDDYMFPWFMWKSRRIANVAIDMDGVICEDCTVDQDDDGQKYLQFLNNVAVKFHTNHVIGAIVTSRLEKYRPQTEAWLAKHQFRYNKLIMGPWDNKAQRRAHDAGIWKAETFNNLPYTLYVESSKRQAEVMFNKTPKTIYCIENSLVYNNCYTDPTLTFIT